jgi:pyruvate formate lyase activating enzyme
MAADDIVLGGFTPLSSCDWPGELVATVFCQGCPLACRYCHNPDLLAVGRGGGPAWPEVLSFLEARRGLLDGVVFSGGEPTMQAGLPAAVAASRALGFRVGLHTAGPYPHRLAHLLSQVDWVGFDVKAPFDDYEAITGVPGSGARARESLAALVDSGVAFDIRTTVHPTLLSEDDLARLDADLAALGTGPTRRQPFRATGCRDSELLAFRFSATTALPAHMAGVS